MKTIPAFTDTDGYGGQRGHYERNAAAAGKPRGQRPRVIQLTHSCGTVLPYKTETYTEAGEARLRAEYAKKPCGMCSECYAADRRLTNRNADDYWRDQYRRSL